MPTKNKKIPKNKEIILSQDDITMQFIPVDMATKKVIVLDGGTNVYTDQHKLVDDIYRSHVRGNVVIMSRCISNWRVQSKLHISDDPAEGETDVFPILRT